MPTRRIPLRASNGDAQNHFAGATWIRRGSMLSRLKLFLSSPGDVPRERLRAELIVDRLAQDYARYFTLETYRWEYEPMLASGHFQDSIDPPDRKSVV